MCIDFEATTALAVQMSGFTRPLCLALVGNEKQCAATDCDALQLAPDQPAAPIGGVQRLS